MASRFRYRRRQVSFNFLDRLEQPSVPNLTLENNGSVEHKGFGLLVPILVFILLLIVTLTAHGMANAINPQ